MNSEVSTIRYLSTGRCSLRSASLIALLVVLTACASSRPRSDAPSQTVATIGRQGIGRHELDAYLKYSVGFIALAYPDSAEAACVAASVKPVCRRLKNQALVRLIQERVVLNFANRHHIHLVRNDQRKVTRQMIRLSAKSSPTRSIFDGTTVSRQFMRHVLERQILVQRVEDAVAGKRARQGEQFHIRRLTIPTETAADRSASYRQAILIASGGALPAATRERTEWVAPFRLPRDIRSALTSARPGEYVGPFERTHSFILVRMLAHRIHPYGRPAKLTLMTKYFRAWLEKAVRDAAPRCLGKANRLGPCPSVSMKSA